MMHCNGKCQMMKKLKEEEKKNQQEPARKTENNNVTSSKSFFLSLAVCKINTPKTYFFPFASSISKGTHSDIFHPPGLV